MDEYLSDKEQVERLRQWWRENGWFLLGGAALGGLGLFGWNQYNAYEDRRAEQAAALYESIKDVASDADTSQAVALLEQLRTEFPDQVYTQQAGMLVARTQLVSAPERAAEELRFTMENSADTELAMIARLRLARVLAYREQYQEALALLTVDTPGQFAGRINEIKGDVLVALGRIDEARAAYFAAMVAPGAELLDRGYLQMKLGDLPADPLAATGDAAPESAASPPASDAAVETPAAPAAPPGEGA